MASTKTRGKATKFARGSAVAFAVGLFLAGPQAVAAADDGVDTSAGPTGPRAADAGSASSPRSAGPASRGQTSSRVGATRRPVPLSGDVVGDAVGSGTRGAVRTDLLPPAAQNEPASEPAHVAALARRPAAGADLTSAAIQVDSGSEGVRRPRAVLAEPVRPASNPTSEWTAPPASAMDVKSPEAIFGVSKQANEPLPNHANGPLPYTAAPVDAVTPNPELLSASGSTPNVAATPRPAVFSSIPTAAEVQNKIDGVVRQVFNTSENWLISLPGSPLVDFVGGALQIVRRSFFNQAPRVVPSIQTTSGDGTITGRIGAFDLEGDSLTYTVTNGPSFGAVAVNTDGVYTYTPGEQFSGSDSLTVKITPEKRSLDLLNLASDGSREVTIKIGDPTFYDSAAVGVFLADASGRLSVKRNLFNQFIGSVTLNKVTPDTQLRWMDSSGLLGTVTVDKVAKLWPTLQAQAAQNGGSLSLNVSYAGADGSENAVLLDNVQIATDPAGGYVFTGVLSPDLPLDRAGVDRWDVEGKYLKPMYENFRTTYNIQEGQLWKFSGADVEFDGAVITANTMTPTVYEKSGLYAHDSEANPQTAGPGGATATTSPQPTPAVGAPVSSTSPVTASIVLSDRLGEQGQTVVVGRADGSIEMWVDGQKEQLASPGAFEAQGHTPAAVSRILEYNRPLKDDQGNTVPSTFTGYISGNTLTVTGVGVGSAVVVGSTITGAEVADGTTITKFLPQTVKCADKTCETTVINNSAGINGGVGTYEVSITQTVGSPSPQPSPDNPSVQLPPGVEFAQEDVAANAKSFIVGLADGQVFLWQGRSGTNTGAVPAGGWVQLHDEGWAAGVTAMAAYNEGVVVGLKNGSVQMWRGPEKDKDTSAWASNWTELQDTSWAQPVTAIIAHNYRICDETGCASKLDDDGLVVALGDDEYLNQGAVFLWDPKFGFTTNDNDATVANWLTLKEGSESGVPGRGVTVATIYQDGIAFGFTNGWVEGWDGTIDVSNFPVTNFTGTRPFRCSGGDVGVCPVTSMVAYGQDDLVVGYGQHYGPDDQQYRYDGQAYDSNGQVFDYKGEVYSYNGKSRKWTWLTDPALAPGVPKSESVNTLVPLDSEKLGGGVVVGWDSGDVALWTGKQPTSTESAWVALHNRDWGAVNDGEDVGVRTIVPISQDVIGAKGAVAQDGLVVGLDNGTLVQWSGASAGPNNEGWTVLSLGAGGNAASDVLRYDPQGTMKCENYRCYDDRPLARAVEFATSLGTGGNSFFTSPTWKQAGSIGSDADPIFGDSRLWPAFETGGTTYAFAMKTPLAGALTRQYPERASFTGVINVVDKESADCKGSDSGSKYCSVLTVITTDPKSPAIKEGMLVDWKGNLVSGTPEILNKLTSSPEGERYLLSGDGGKPVTATTMTGTPTPSAYMGLDVNVVAYGYAFVPDGFTPKMDPSRWSVAMLEATEIGPSIGVNLSTKGDGTATSYGPPEDLAEMTKYVPLALGAQLTASVGAKAAVDLVINGLQSNNENRVDAYAYLVPGVLFTSNTLGAPGGQQFGSSWYRDLNASDFKDISGVLITPTLTPYFNVGLNVGIPPGTPVIGGWSVFNVTGGYENPVYATVCADVKGLCPAGGDGGVNGFYGVVNNGTFNPGTVPGTYTASAGQGKILTVTGAPLYNPGQVAAGQLVAGSGVAAGSMITKDLGEVKYDGKVIGRQYQLDGEDQLSIGGGYSGTFPKLTAYKPGSKVSVTLGTEGLLAFKAGFLPGLWGGLTYNTEIPLYQINGGISLVDSALPQ